MPSTNIHKDSNISVVNALTTNQTLLLANNARRRLIINNTGTGNLYIKFGATASTTSFTYKLAAGGLYETKSPAEYIGQIDGIWDSAVGAAIITELC